MAWPAYQAIGHTEHSLADWRFSKMVRAFAKSPGLYLATYLAKYGGWLDADLREPQGEAALLDPQSVSWCVFKNPMALSIGGIAAVILELAEPRVRTGIWEHSTFRRDPVLRIRRTALAAMMTVFGPESLAKRMIQGVRRKHATVVGTTPRGVAYSASDPELLAWVQATASFGFLEAYRSFVYPLDIKQCDRFYREGASIGRLYGSASTPSSLAAQQALFARTIPGLERSEIEFEFIKIIQHAPILPAAARPVQKLLVRAAIQILPSDIRTRLALCSLELRPWEKLVLVKLGRLADHLPIPESPPLQACERLGLPSDYLYRPEHRCSAGPWPVQQGSH